MWLYIILTCIAILFRLSYLFVPIYDIYCQVTGFGGNLKYPGTRDFKIEPNKKNLINKSIEIDFERSYNNQIIPNSRINIEEIKNTNINILFKPTIKKVTTIIGKPTLAFYVRENLTNKTIQGIRTYNVTPRKAAPYFHKLECFCFDEQRIKPFETIEMPLLFYIDPEIIELNQEINLISINYTFFISE